MGMYCITGVFKRNGVITELMLNELDERNAVQKGKKVSEDYIIQLLEKLNYIRVLQWSYKTGRWEPGDYLKIVNGKRKILKSHREHVVTDSLDLLINLNAFL